MVHRTLRPLTAEVGVASPHIQVFSYEALASMLCTEAPYLAPLGMWMPVCTADHSTLRGIKTAWQQAIRVFLCLQGGWAPSIPSSLAHKQPHMRPP